MNNERDRDPKAIVSPDRDRCVVRGVGGGFASVSEYVKTRISSADAMIGLFIYRAKLK